MKRKIKKSIAIILAISMLGSSNISVFANQLTTAEQVMQTPDAVLTKGQFVALLNASLKLENGAGENFKDVKSDSPFYKDLLIAKTIGYLKGDGFGSVYPDQFITGAEAITCINYFLGFDMSKVNIINGLNVPTWAQAPASNLIDLTMIDKSMAEKKTITVDDAKKLVDAISTALMFNDSPFSLKQASLEDDFYAYENRQFMATAKIPQGYPGATSFTKLQILADNQINNILEEIINTPNLATNSNEWTIKEIYNMYMDNDSRTKSIERIKPVLNDIKNANSLKDLADVRNKYSKHFDLVSKLYDGLPLGDVINDGSKWSYIVGYSNLGMQNKGYYEVNDNTTPIHEAYKKYIANVLAYIGETDNVNDRANAYFAFEKSLADKQKPLAEQSQLSFHFKPISWSEYDSIVANIRKDIIVPNKELDEKLRTLNLYCGDTDYLKFVNSLYSEQNLNVLKDMMLLNVVTSVGDYLGDDFKKFKQDLLSVAIGVSGELPENIKAQNTVKGIMTNAISELYVEKYADKKVKENVTKMAEELRNKRIERVQKLDWMSQKTKNAAIEKLKAIKFYVSYPDSFDKDLYSPIVSKDNGGTLIDIYYNVVESSASYLMKKLSKPANEIGWDNTTPYDAGAFYNLLENVVVVPNAILGAPFYDINRDEASNLGGIGYIIGHELTHSIDTNGSMYDKNGTMSNWWTEEDHKQFKNLASVIATELSKLSIGDGMQINGELAVSEVIADLGGFATALDIANDKKLDSKSIFVTYANIWASRFPKQMALVFLSDVHPPDMIRVNFPVAQQDEFYKTFNIKPGDKMYVAPEQRRNIW